MSKQRIKWLVSITALLLSTTFVVFLFPVPRYALVGWYRGENFHGGKPTCYWRDSIIASRQPIPPGLYRDYLTWMGHRSDDAYVPLLRGDPASLPVLQDLLRDEDVLLRSLAANGLANVQRRALNEGTTAPGLAATVPPLMEVLARVDDSGIIQSDRLGAAIALGECGPMAKPAIPLLREKMDWPAPLAQLFVARSLCKIDPREAEARQRLITGLADTSPIIRHHAVAGLEELLRYHPVEGLHILRQELALPAALQAATELENKNTTPSPEGNVRESIERLLREVAPKQNP